MKVPVMNLCERCKVKLTDMFILEPLTDIWDMNGQCSFCWKKTYTLPFRYERKDAQARRERIARRKARGPYPQKDRRAQYRPPFREDF